MRPSFYWVHRTSVPSGWSRISSVCHSAFSSCPRLNFSMKEGGGLQSWEFKYQSLLHSRSAAAVAWDPESPAILLLFTSLPFLGVVWMGITSARLWQRGSARLPLESRSWISHLVRSAFKLLYFSEHAAAGWFLTPASELAPPPCAEY